SANIPLIRKAAATGKPIIVSTNGTACRDAAGPNALFLHCVSEYPCPLDKAHVERVQGFDGFSDHTLGSLAAIVATTLGATVIEKHLALSHSCTGPDGSFSMDPKEFAQLVADVKDAYSLVHPGARQPTSA